jgi:hypothetical protein
MRKYFTIILLSFFLLFFSFQVASASFLGSPFGGRIILKPALQILSLQLSGFVCPMYGGTSISIIPIGSPVGTPINYYIPPTVFSVTGTTPTLGQLILGLHGGKIPIICTQTATGATVTVTLDIITYFGTSQH